MNRGTGPHYDPSFDDDAASPPPEVDVLLRMYDWLREEINQSYHRQHRIVASQATLIGIAFGVYYTANSFTANADLNGFMQFLKVVSLLLPPLVVASSALWLTEHVRVMRAGNYLQMVEHRVNGHLNGHPLSWEAWLRDPIDRVGLRKFLNPHSLYDICHILAYPIFFLSTGVASLIIAIMVLGGSKQGSSGLNVQLNQPSTYVDFLSSQDLGIQLYFGILAVALILIVGMVLFQIPHQFWDHSHVDFEEWLHRHFSKNPEQDNDNLRELLEKFEDKLRLDVDGEAIVISFRR